MNSKLACGALLLVTIAGFGLSKLAAHGSDTSVTVEKISARAARALTKPTPHATSNSVFGSLFSHGAATASAANKTAQISASDSSAEISVKLSRLGDQVLSQLPRVSEIRKLDTEAVHEIPKPVFAASQHLKIYADELDGALRTATPGSAEYLAAASAGAQFYGDCASGDQTPQAIRAVCFVEYLKMSQKSNQPADLSRVHVTPGIVKIARAISS